MRKAEENASSAQPHEGITRHLPKYPNVPLLLLILRENLMIQLRPAMTEQGFTDQQWRIARQLYLSGPLEPRELCERSCVLSPSMAGILKRMENLGMIVRAPSRIDKRRVLISLAAGMEEKILAVMMTNRQVYDQLWAHVGEDKMQQLIELLTEITAQTHGFRMQK